MTLTQPSTAIATQTTPRTVGRRYQALAIMFGVSLVLLAGIGSRLAYLQLVEGNRNRQLAENNRIRLIPGSPNAAKFSIAKAECWQAVAYRIRFFCGL